MINYIFGGMILIAVVFGICSGNADALAQSVVDGAEEGIQLLITMAGSLMLWSGIMEVAARGGVTDIIGKVLSPVLCRLFRNVEKDSKVLKKISMNVSANFLGIGNAATPFGLSAMKELKKLDDHGDRASDDMIAFVVLNTASIQLVPTMIGTLRQSYGSIEPFSIIPCVWISSVCALIVGQCVVRFLRGR